MWNRTQGLFGAALLSSTALVTAAVAQQTQQQIAPGEACERLSAIVEEQQDTFQQQWLTEAETAVEQGQPDACVQYVQAAMDALDQGDGAERIEGRIVVSQEPADVTVQQPAPEVTVTQPDPQVTVNQQQPEVIVRQAPPTVRIEMPRPIVTITQPDPEIIVNMPEPEIDVQTGQPQVDVAQGQPQVDVDQPEPQIDVQMGEVQGGQEQADVEIQQGQAQVILEDQGGQQAQVDLQQQQPSVRFESAEPIIEFVESGEPQVQLEQTGQQQAQGQLQPGSEDETRMASGMQDDSWRQGREPFQPPQIERADMQQPTADQMSLESLLETDVFDVNDENLGTVTEVVLDDSGATQYVVVDIGGFLGIGSSPVAVGFDEMTLLTDDAGELRAYVDATRQELEDAPRYEQQ
jgi:hypothetical protein